MISATPERVFSVLSDLAVAQRWMPAIQRIDGVSPGAFQLATAWQETRKAGNRVMQSTLNVSTFERPSKLGLHVEAKTINGDLSFRTSPKATGTEVTYEA